MHRKYIYLILLSALLLLAGCKPTVDGPRYLQSLMDTLYKASYTDYAELTGTTTAEISTLRDTWMIGQTDRFLKAFNAGKASDATRSRVTDLLNHAYAVLDYTVAEDEDGLSISLRPILLVKDNYAVLAEYKKTFNEKNKAYTYADLDSEAYTDAYMDGLLTILEQGLASIPEGDLITVPVTLYQGEDGLYAPDEVTIKKLQLAAFPLEASEVPETETETEAQVTETETETETKAKETKVKETKAKETEAETKAKETKAKETKAKETEAETKAKETKAKETKAKETETETKAKETKAKETEVAETEAKE